MNLLGCHSAVWVLQWKGKGNQEKVGESEKLFVFHQACSVFSYFFFQSSYDAELVHRIIHQSFLFIEIIT